LAVIKVALETETGEELAKVTGLRDLGQFLPDDDPSSKCLRYIHSWGDTTFNALQMEPFLEELNQLVNQVDSAGLLEALDDVKRLAERCRSERLYLKFYGD
jgi:hypothetical protein